MRRVLVSTLALTTLTVGGLALPGVALAEDVTFKTKPLEDGTSLDQRTEMKMNIDMKAFLGAGSEESGEGAMTMTMDMSDLEDKHVELREDGLSIAYKDKKQVMKMLGQDQVEAHPVTGQSYSLSTQGGDLVVTHQGEPPTTISEGPVAEEVRGELKDMEMLSSFVDSLGTKTVTVGETYDLTKMSGPLGAFDANGAKMESGSLTLTGVRKVDGEKCGVFEMKMKMLGDDPSMGLTMTIEVAGEILVSTKTGWLHQMNFTGPVTMNGQTESNGMPMRMSGAGTFTYTTDVGYGK